MWLPEIARLWLSGTRESRRDFKRETERRKSEIDDWHAGRAVCCPRSCSNLSLSSRVFSLSLSLSLSRLPLTLSFHQQPGAASATSLTIALTVNERGRWREEKRRGRGELLLLDAIFLRDAIRDSSRCLHNYNPTNLIIRQ